MNFIIPLDMLSEWPHLVAGGIARTLRNHPVFALRAQATDYMLSYATALVNGIIFSYVLNITIVLTASCHEHFCISMFQRKCRSMNDMGLLLPQLFHIGRTLIRASYSRRSDHIVLGSRHLITRPEHEVIAEASEMLDDAIK